MVAMRDFKQGYAPKYLHFGFEKFASGALGSGGYFEEVLNVRGSVAWVFGW